jgi:hypothetical protein
MKAFNNPKFIKKQHLTDKMLMEIIFKDQSRFLGEVYEDSIQGSGTLYVQDLAKLSGVFFKDQIGEGQLEFDGVLRFEGKFDENERLETGMVTFSVTEESIEIYVADGILYFMNIFDKEKKFLYTADAQALPNFRFGMGSGYILSISDDSSEITFAQEYGDGISNGHFLMINLKENYYWHHYYLNGVRSEKQKEVYFKSPPYTVVFTPKDPNGKELPLLRMSSANGNIFESNQSIKKGVTRHFEKDYAFFGGIDGSNKHGAGNLVFNDGCEKAVEYKDDKICFEGIEEAFNFVKNFTCLNHKDLRFSENIAMIKFMEELEYFEGKMRKGTSEGKVIMEYKNGWKYTGAIRNFKMHGFSEIDSPKWKISGEFLEGEIKYGFIHYVTGAVYEGQLMHLRKTGKGVLAFANGYMFRGNFSNDELMRYGGLLVTPKKEELDVQFVMIYEFDLGIFITKKEELFVLISGNDCVYDAHFIDKLEESGISIRDSLRNII